MKTGAIVGWSGNGSLDDLHRSVASKLGVAGDLVFRGPVSLRVEHSDPVRVASRLSHLPGASWVAAGYEFAGWRECASVLQTLAKRYLREGSSFRLTASVEDSERSEGDLLLDGNGVILKAVKKARVDEKKPDVTFRVVMAKDSGAAGVELRRGPGGVPTSKRMRAVCLASGGYHSAAVAWMAALSGYQVTLVHSRSDDESLRQVSRLYAELSRRMDVSGLELQVLNGSGSPGERLDGWLAKNGGEIMAGAHPECRGVTVREAFRNHPGVVQPLLLLQEDEVRSRVESLGIRIKGIDDAPTLSMTGDTADYVTRRYGKRETDINGVLDSILS